MSNLKRFAGLSSVYSLGSIAQSAISFFLLPLYAIYLSPKDFGVIALVSIVVALITILIESPAIAALTRYFYNPDFEDTRPVFVFTLFVFTLIQSIILALLFYVLAAPVCRLIFSDTEWLQIVQLYSLVVLFKPLSVFFQTILKITEKALFFVITNMASVLLVFGVVIYLLKNDYGLYSIVIGTVINTVFLTVFSSPVFFKIIRLQIKFKLLIRPLVYAYPLVVSNFSQILYDTIDRYILRLFVGIKDIGLYDLGYRISGIYNTVVSTPMGQSLMPIVFKDEKEPDKIRSFLSRFATYYYVAGMGIALVISLFAKEIITVIMLNKPDFLGAWKIIPVVIFAHVLHGLGNFLGWGIILKEKSSYFSAIMVVALLGNIGLNFLLIPFWGITGAAIATLISYYIWNILKMYYSAKFYNLHFQIKELLIISVLAYGMCLTGIFLIDFDYVILNIIFKLSLVFIYILYFAFSSFFEKTDKQYIRELAGKVLRMKK